MKYRGILIAMRYAHEPAKSCCGITSIKRQNTNHAFRKPNS